MSFGDKIKKLRKEKDWSQDYLGKQIGVHGRHIGKYEKGRVLPNAETAIRLAKIFNVSIDYLLIDNETRRHEETDFSKIQDSELFRSFEIADQMNDEDKEVIKRLLDAFIKKNQMEALLQK